MGNWAVLIPARAGSKSIKNKNLMPINGAPLVMHSIETACNLKNIKQVYVSTDSKDISKICSSTGVTVLERPDVLVAILQEMRGICITLKII